MRRLILGLIVVVATNFAIAADKPAYGPAPNWIQPPQFPGTLGTGGDAADAAIKILLLDQQLNFSPSGDESYFENVVRIQTPQGLAAMSTISVPWKPETDVLTFHKLHIVRGEERIDVLADGQAFTVLRRENNLEYSALDGILTAAIQPPGLRVGDIVDIAFSVKRTDQVLAGTSEQILGGWPELPIARVQVRARWPTSSPIRWKPGNAIAGIKENRADGFTEVTLALKDIEPLQQPVGAPLRFRLAREIEFSGFQSWNEISKRLAPLYTQAATLTSESALHAEVARIRAAATDPGLRAAAALALVQDQVRYVFLGMNDGGLVPADAELTWKRRFGDCKAKTALLLALLRELDINAEPIAVNTVLGDGLNTRLPRVGWFDHVLVRAVIAGKTHWLDGTRLGDRRLDKLAVPNYHWGLPLVATGNELVQIPTTPLTEPIVSTTIRIDASSGIYAQAPFHVETIFRADAAIAFRAQLGNLTPADRERGLRAYWSKAYDFVEAQTVSATFDELTNEQHLIMDGLATMDWKGRVYVTDGMRVGYEADFTRPPEVKSQAPFAVPFPMFTRTKEIITLPKQNADFKLDGDNYDRVIAGVEYKRHSKIERGVFSAEASRRSVKDEFPFADAAAAQRVLREMNRDSLYIQAPTDYLFTDNDVAAEIKRPLHTANDYIDRGHMLMRKSNYELAITELSKAIDLDAKADMAWADRGLAYVWTQDYGRARSDFDKAFALNARNAVVYRGRGLLALRTAQLTEAIANLTKSLEIEPQNNFALENRARAYAQAGQPDLALIDAAEAIRLGSSAIDMYMLRANIFSSQGKKDKAMAEAAALIAANPSNPIAYIGAGTVYASLKMNAEAAKAFDRAIDIGPSENAYLVRAAYRPRNDRAGKRADIDSALKLNDRSVRALMMKAILQMESADYAGAIASYDSALTISTGDAGLLSARGIAYAKSNQTALAEKDFAAARAEASGAASLNNMCWTMATHNVALPTALTLCDEAVAKAPSAAGFIDSRAFVLLRLGRYDEAIVSYDSALKLEPSKSTSLYGRGIAKRLKGDVTAGDVDIKQALALNATIGEEFSEYGLAP